MAGMDCCQMPPPMQPGGAAGARPAAQQARHFAHASPPHTGHHAPPLPPLLSNPSAPAPAATGCRPVPRPFMLGVTAQDRARGTTSGRCTASGAPRPRPAVCCAPPPHNRPPAHTHAHVHMHTCRLAPQLLRGRRRRRRHPPAPPPGWATPARRPPPYPPRCSACARAASGACSCRPRWAGRPTRASARRARTSPRRGGWQCTRRSRCCSRPSCSRCALLVGLTCRGRATLWAPAGRGRGGCHLGASRAAAHTRGALPPHPHSLPPHPAPDRWRRQHPLAPAAAAGRRPQWTQRRSRPRRQPSRRCGSGRATRTGCRCRGHPSSGTSGDDTPLLACVHLVIGWAGDALRQPADPI